MYLFHLIASLYNSDKFSIVCWPFLIHSINSLNLIRSFISETQYQLVHQQHAFWVEITVSQCNLTAQGYAAFSFLFHFCVPCRPGRGNFYLGSLASFNIDVTCLTISYMSETICQPQLALKMYQHLVIHFKFFLFCGDLTFWKLFKYWFKDRRKEGE